MSGSVPCRSCGTPVVWARTATGKAMPVDAAPDPKGNLVLVWARTVVEARVVRGDAPHGYPLRLSHFATCLQAMTRRKDGAA